VADAHTETFELRADATNELFEDHFSVLLGTLQWVTERLIQENQTQDAPPYSPPEDAVDQLIGDRELGLVERIFLLRRTLGFRNANVNSTARLARAMKEVRLPAGETIWRPGDRANSSLFIVKGKMELSWQRLDTGHRVVQTVGPSYIVGGAESLANRPRWNELVTTEPTVFLQGSRERLIDMLEDDLEVALQFLSMLASFLLMAWDRKAESEALGSTNAPKRLERHAGST
jgi:CRP-like cAMP-binding protein